MTSYLASFSKRFLVAILAIILLLPSTTAYASSGIFTQAIQEAQCVNSDVKGWLYIPNTNISYPVLQRAAVCSKHGAEDNCYYLEKNLYGNYAGAYDTSAAIFMDFRNSSLNGSFDRNTIIYGHNWTNIESGSALKVAAPNDYMFAQLPSFADRSFAERTPYFLIESGGEQYVFVVFAASYVVAYDLNTKSGFYYIDVAPSDSEFTSLVNEMKRTSVHNYNVDVSATDTIVTLSTCTYKQVRDGNGRFIVAGRLLREGEQIPVSAQFGDLNSIPIMIS